MVEANWANSSSTLHTVCCQNWAFLQETHTLYVPSSSSFDLSARQYRSHKGTNCGFRWQIMPNLETFFQCVPKKSKMGKHSSLNITIFTLVGCIHQFNLKKTLKIIECTISAFKKDQKLSVQWWTLHMFHEEHIGDKCYSAAWTYIC